MLLRSGYDCLVGVVKPGGEELVGRRKKVAVTVHCDADVRVAEAYGDRLRVRPDGDEQARAGVAEVVEAEPVLLRRQGSPDCGLERPPVPEFLPITVAPRFACVSSITSLDRFTSPPSRPWGLRHASIGSAHSWSCSPPMPSGFSSLGSGPAT